MQMLQARLYAYLLVHSDAWAADSSSLTAVQGKGVSGLRSMWDKPLLILGTTSLLLHPITGASGGSRLF